MGDVFPQAQVQQCTMDGEKDSTPATTQEQATTRIPEWSELSVEEQEAVINVIRIAKEWRDQAKDKSKRDCQK